MNKMKRSLPTAITSLVVGLALSITLIYSLLLLAYSWLVEDNIFNRLVASEAAYIEQIYSEQGQIVQPRSSFMTLHKNWQKVPNIIIQQHQLKPSQIEFSLDDGRTLHINKFVLANDEYVLLADVAGLEVGRDYLPSVISWLVVIAILLASIVSVMAFIIAKKLTRPIKLLADEVSQFSVLSPTPSFVRRYPDNELRTLANTIEQCFSQLQSALIRERNFTRDVSHEIRTPISVVKNIVSNNQHVKQISESEFEQVTRANFDLEKVTHTLLALARNESSKVYEINLTEMLENTLLHHFELNHSEKGKALQIDLQLAENVKQIANPNLVQILLNNVLSNIVQYSNEAEVNITLTNNAMSFSNQTEELVPTQPNRQGVKSISSTGIGQGLNLIERICEKNNWRLNANYQKGIFTLEISFSTK
jgi:signal transduction histidine kinase